MRILLAADGSEATEDAERILTRIPFTSDVELMIAHVEIIPSIAHLKREFPSSVDAILAQYRAQSDVLLAREESRFKGVAGTVRTCLRRGHTAETLLELAEDHNAELIVVGARGLSRTQQFLIGSTSATIAKHARCSVLVTRHSHSAESSHRTIRIVLGVDGSDASQDATTMLAALPWGEDFEILVVNVLENEARMGDWEAEVHQAIQQRKQVQREQIVHSAVDQLRKATSRVAGEVIQADSVAEELLSTLKRVDADLLVVGHRGMSRIKRFFIGSTCDQVLRHAPCSVWIHKESE